MNYKLSREPSVSHSHLSGILSDPGTGTSNVSFHTQFLTPPGLALIVEWVHMEDGAVAGAYRAWLQSQDLSKSIRRRFLTQSPDIGIEN